MNRKPTILATTMGQVDLVNPRPEDFTLDLLVSTMANKCRFNGTTEFYSIAQHLVLGSYLCAAPREYLLHELDEVFLPDMATPLKRLLADWYEIALPHMLAGAKAFGIAWPLPECVWDTDDRMLATEVRDLGIKWPQDVPLAEPYKMRILPMGPELAARLFRARLRECHISTTVEPVPSRLCKRFELPVNCSDGSVCPFEGEAHACVEGEVL